MLIVLNLAVYENLSLSIYLDLLFLIVVFYIFQYICFAYILLNLSLSFSCSLVINGICKFYFPCFVSYTEK